MTSVSQHDNFGPPPASGSLVSRLFERFCLAGSVLVIPLSILLFAQWPLRDWVGRWSHEADDFGQICFAVFIGIAVTYATRRRAHLAADVLAHRYSLRTRMRLERAAALLIALPWSAFVLYAAWPSLIRSVAQLEGFADTYNPGFFLLRVAVALLAALVLIQALLDGFGKRP